MRIGNKEGRSRSYLVGLLGATTLVLAGCNGSEDDSSAAADIQYNSPAQIAQVSANDYNLNENGVITGSTLQRWAGDWLSQRPAGITGKLVILQVSDGSDPTNDADPNRYFPHNGTNVFTYLEPDWVETRSNGVAATRSMVLSGTSIDSLLQKYNIDPTKDMIVCAQGFGRHSYAMGQGRCWYTLRYWGVAAEHIAILNGGNNWLETSLPLAMDVEPSDPPSAPGAFSVKSLNNDNTQLQATLEDMLNILPSSDRNVLDDGVFIWDARGLNQYSAGEDDGAGTPVADYMDTFQNNGSRQGHPNGALELNFSNLLVSAEGWRYKSKAELNDYLYGRSAGDNFVDATYQPVGAGNAYQDGDTIYTYCETTYRAMITGIASAVVLGKPTRFYDGAMVEWNSMSYLQDATGNHILPIDSPWRTDTKSFFRPANDIAKVEPRVIDDAYAGSANAIVREDRAYKVTEGDGADSGGSAPVANGCG